MTFPRLRRFGGSLRSWLASRRTQATLLAVVLVIGILLVGNSASAIGLPEVKNWIFGVIGEALAFIIELLGKLIILLTNVLISFAEYNNFVRAPAVVIGWVLVRDVVNMFFIVILLVSAFSTIIGYSEFHYSKVLPKLLLMAVLINFSKTLIGLLIDFSQVLMLTFVNAFAPAAGGNFITMLHLNDITRLDEKLSGGKLTTDTAGDLIVASLLGVIMLSITLTVIVIMIAFLIYRIIALWMLLIISPMAFFALALPGKLAKGMSAFTSSFWERLSSLLIGGPVMAFFIWLALAIAQGGTGYNDLYNKNSTEIADAARFVSAAGSPENLAAFVVAIGFLLAGVEFAVKTSSSLSPTLGKFASGISSGGGALPNTILAGLRASQRTARVVGKGARAVGAGVGAVGRGADYLSGNRLSSAVGRAGLAIAPGSAGAAGLAGRRAGNIKAAAGALSKQNANLNPAARDARLRKLAGGFGQSATAAQMLLAETGMSPVGGKASVAKFEKQLAGRKDLSAAERTNLAKAMANDQLGQDIKRGMEAAKNAGDDEKLGKFAEEIEKNPSRGTGWGDFRGVKNGADDPKKLLANLNEKTAADSRSQLAYLSALGIVSADGTINRSDDEKSNYQKIMKGGRGEVIRNTLDAFEKDPNGKLKIAATLAAIDGKATPEQLKLAESSRYYASRNSQGKVAGNFIVESSTAPGSVGRNDEAVKAGQARLKVLAESGASPTSAEVVATKAAMLGSGARISEAFKFKEKEGAFEDEGNREAYQSVISKYMEGLKSGEKAALAQVSQLDVKSLAANPDSYNEARAATVEKLDLGALKAGFEAAEKTGNTALKDKLQDILSIVQREADRNNRITRGYANNAQLAEVATTPDSVEASRIITNIATASHQTRDQIVQGARAEILRIGISEDPQMRVLQRGVSPTAERVAREAGERAGATASAAGARASGAVRAARERLRPKPPEGPAV
ncbi:MAG: hypothetical protein ABIO72_00215 [Patescibacteria group bacterium]